VTVLYSLLLYIFLVLFHGGKQNINDIRIHTDRQIMLSIPAVESNTNSSKSTSTLPQTQIHLDDLLRNYLFDNKVSVRRQPSRDADLALADFPPYAQSKNEKDPNIPLAIDAWSALRLLPVYTSQSETGEMSMVSSNDLQFGQTLDCNGSMENPHPTTPIIFPLVLKRYYVNDKGEIRRNSQSILVPLQINVDDYFESEIGDLGTERISGKGWVLNLISGVVHLGNSPQSGHYVGYSITKYGVWWRMDDLNGITKHEDVREIMNCKYSNLILNILFLFFFSFVYFCFHPYA